MTVVASKTLYKDQVDAYGNKLKPDDPKLGTWMKMLLVIFFLGLAVLAVSAGLGVFK